MQAPVYTGVTINIYTEIVIVFIIYYLSYLWLFWGDLGQWCKCLLGKGEVVGWIPGTKSKQTTIE